MCALTGNAAVTVGMKRKRELAAKPTRALGAAGLGRAAPDQAGAVGDQERNKRHQASQVNSRAAANRAAGMDNA